MEKNFRFKLNGKTIDLASSPERMLLWVLRSDLELTGTKYSCGEGFCGACTVLVDNEPVLSCQFPLKEAEGKEVLTIEGLGKNGELHPLQDAFMQHNALQCGFCTPGMLLGAYALLLKNPEPSTKDIVDTMEGNLCRCGSYKRIIQAIQTAARTMRGERP
ncbi:MAG: (2Fe-2S)-binding protein [Candidatus Aminicenantes bacterium]|nr:(2Fe-2S)-binding protein [Candidatus Aminicenantes bacterium]MDH5467848.1 (2Fe-2S)-binding protein [Candidatus Aminicenantes bacterium]MDH5743068.1 (2Fe-2S)-binding protein [Candidatus Aminicenantes bacterium]